MTSFYGELCASYYDLSKPVRPDAPDVRFYAPRLRADGGTTLVVGAGNGRFLLPLAAAGLAVEGLEPAGAMLRRLEANARALGLRPTVHGGLMQEFEAPGKYRSIVVPNGTFQLLVDDRDVMAALARFRASLADGGRLYLPLFLPDEGLFTQRGAWVEREPLAEADGSELRLSVSNRIELFSQIIRGWNRYERWQDGRVIRTEMERFDRRWYGVKETALLLHSAGFRDVTVTGDYTDDPPTAQSVMLCFSAVRA